MTHDSPPSALAEARASDLARLREQYAFENSAASSFALAKGLWQNGLYDEAFEQFTRTRDMAPRAPDAGVSLIRAAMTLGRLEAAEAALDHALSVDPDLPMLLLHRAQLLAGNDPVAARDALAGCHSDALCALFHDALDAIAGGGPVAARTLDKPEAQAMWSGLVWLTSQQPAPRLFGTPTEVLRHAVDAARLDGLVLECGVYFGRSLALLAQWAGQRCHGFDSFKGKPAQEGTGFDDPASTAGVIPQIAGDVELHAGWFDQTLPPFFAEQAQTVRLLHVDIGDHASALDVLNSAAPWLREGSVIVFDDFIGYAGSEQHEFRAFHDFASRHGLRWEVLSGVVLGREVALRITATA